MKLNNKEKPASKRQAFLNIPLNNSSVGDCELKMLFLLILFSKSFLCTSCHQYKSEQKRFHWVNLQGLFHST